MPLFRLLRSTLIAIIGLAGNMAVAALSCFPLLLAAAINGDDMPDVDAGTVGVANKPLDLAVIVLVSVVCFGVTFLAATPFNLFLCSCFTSNPTKAGQWALRINFLTCFSIILAGALAALSLFQ